jgi:hypothetical protein
MLRIRSTTGMWTAQSFAQERNGKTPFSLSVSTLQGWRAFQVILVEKFYKSMEKVKLVEWFFFEPALSLQKGQDIAVEILCTFYDHNVTSAGVKYEPGSFDVLCQVMAVFGYHQWV